MCFLFNGNFAFVTNKEELNENILRNEKVLTNGKASAVIDMIKDDSFPLANNSHDENT